MKAYGYERGGSMKANGYEIHPRVNLQGAGLRGADLRGTC